MPFSFERKMYAPSYWSYKPVSKIVATTSPRRPVQGGGNEEGVQEVLFGPLALSAADFIKSVSGTVRGAHGTHNTILGGASDSVALSALAVTSAFGLVSGPLTVQNRWGEWKTAQRTQDAWRRFLAGQGVVKGVASTAGSAVMLPCRVLTIASSQTASKGMAVASNVLGKMGAGIGNFSAVLSLLLTGCKMAEEGVFYSWLRGAFLRGAEHVLEILKRKVSLSLEEKAELRRKVQSDPRLGVLPFADKEALVQEQIALEVCRREAKMARVTSQGCVDRIKGASQKEARAVVEMVRGATVGKLKMLATSMGLSVIDFAATLIVLAFAGAGAFLASACLGMIASLGFLALDGYQLWKDFANNVVGKYDHLMLFISTAVCFVAISAAVLLSAGLPALIAAGALGAVWLGINVGCALHMRAQRPPKVTAQRSSPN